MAYTLFKRPQCEQLYLSDTDTSLVAYWLRLHAPQFSIKWCVDATIELMKSD